MLLRGREMMVSLPILQNHWKRLYPQFEAWIGDNGAMPFRCNNVTRGLNTTAAVEDARQR